MTTRITTLASGLRVVTDQIDTVETAAVGVWVSVGARHEGPHEAGVSHFLEHMAFKGTANRSAQDIAETIEGVGGHLNAYTSRETTCYYARVLGDDVPLAVDLLSDILQFSTFREEELMKERDVILQEIGEAQDNPDDIVFDQLQRTAYKDQALGASILGTVESVSSMARATLQRYQDAHYKAPSMVLAAAGKVRHEALVALAEEKFQHLAASPDTALIQAQFSGGTVHLARPLEQVHLMVGYEGLKLGHPRFYTQSILAAILGGGMSSRLFQEIREKRALAYSVYGFTTAFSDSGLLGFSMGTSEKSVQNALDVLAQELESVHTTVSSRELARVKAQLKASLMMALESTSSRCEQLAQQLMIYGRPVSAAELIDRIEAVTLEDVADLAKETFSKPYVVSTVGPLKAPTHLARKAG